MAGFGVLDLGEMQNEDQRLNAEPTEGFLNNFVPMPEVKPGQTGIVAVRILPPIEGGRLFQFTRLHMLNGRKVHCPKPLIGGKWDKNTPCKICEYYNALWAKADELDEKGRSEDAEKVKQEARSIKPVERYYYNAIVRKLVDEKGEHTNVGPRILSVGKVLHKMIVRAIIGDETEPALGDVTNPKTGYDFLIKKELRGTGADAWPNYDRSCFAREPSILGTADEIKNWVGSLHDLKELRVLRTADELDKELAIHRQLIPDEKGKGRMDIDAFDSAYKGRSQGSVGAKITEEDAISSIVGKETVSVPTTSIPSEDLNIDMAEFTKELEGL